MIIQAYSVRTFDRKRTFKWREGVVQPSYLLWLRPVSDQQCSRSQYRTKIV